MTQIDPLTKLNKGESPKSAIINANFEILRLAHNDIVSRINAVIDKLETPPEFNNEIESLNLFGIIGETVYDNNKLSAARLNANFEQFKTALMLTGGVPAVLPPEIPPIIEVLETLPNAPSNLQITGIIIVDQAYLNANPESEASIGDRLVGLSWTDNSDNEVDFEIYRSYATYPSLYTMTLSFLPENNGLLVDTPIENAEVAIINAGNPFYDIAIGEYLPLQEDYRQVNGLVYNYAVRAVNTVGVSGMSRGAYISNGSLSVAEYRCTRPYSVGVEFSALDAEAGTCTATFNWYQVAGENRQGYEIFRRWCDNSLGFNSYGEWQKIAVSPYNQSGTSGGLVVEGVQIPAAVYGGGMSSDMLNQYYEFKVCVFNEFSRSIVTHEDTTDLVRSIMPPLLPANFMGEYTDGDIVLSWDKTNGDDTEMEVWHSTDGEEYTKLSTSGEAGWTYSNGIPIGYTDDNVSEDHHYYKIKAINDNGYNEYSSEISIEITPSSLTPVLSQTLPVGEAPVSSFDAISGSLLSRTSNTIRIHNSINDLSLAGVSQTYNILDTNSHVGVVGSYYITKLLLSGNYSARHVSNISTVVSNSGGGDDGAIGYFDPSGNIFGNGSYTDGKRYKYSWSFSSNGIKSESPVIPPNNTVKWLNHQSPQSLRPFYSENYRIFQNNDIYEVYQRSGLNETLIHTIPYNQAPRGNGFLYGSYIYVYRSTTNILYKAPFPIMPQTLEEWLQYPLSGMDVATYSIKAGGINGKFIIYANTTPGKYYIFDIP